jgi:hypothetical protein
MRRKPETYALIVQELDLAMDLIERQYEKNRRMTARVSHGQNDELDWAALGYTLHNLYNAMENYFLRVSKFFENNLSNESWRQDLVNRMCFSVEGLRPALLPANLRLMVHDLRAFRHVFRNVYDRELDPDRVAKVNDTAERVLLTFRDAHKGFVQDLRTIAAEIE